jgi:hypothetical protein
LILWRLGKGDTMARSKRRGSRRSRRREPTDVAPLDVGAVVRQVGLFEAVNGLPHGVAAGAVGVVVVLVALLVRPVARLLKSVTQS